MTVCVVVCSAGLLVGSWNTGVSLTSMPMYPGFLCGEDLTGSSCGVCSVVVDKDNVCMIILALFVVKIVGGGPLVWMG